MMPLTVAERTGYRETSRHADVLRFIDELRGIRPVFRVESMGHSSRGQDMPVLVFGERPGTPVVLVIANIHAGEVEGKEALLMLARDLPERYFEKLTLLFIPNYNPDGNDAIDPKNRALDLSRLEGQIGPEGGVGTRTTAEGINLNRDYMKMEAVESRNLSKLQAKWKPHLTVDSHTTDGSIHGYALTFDTSHLPCGPADYVRSTMLPDVSRRLEARTGLKTFFYGNFVDEKDPSKGWATYPHFPRYGSHYRGLTGRLDVLLETYSYISFRERVFTTVEILKDIFDYTTDHAAEIKSLCADGMAARPDPVGIAYGPPLPIGDCEILAWDLESQLARKIPGREAKTYRMPHLAKFVPSKTVPRPAGYLIPRDCSSVVRTLEHHGIVLERLTEGRTFDGEADVVVDVSKADSPDVGTLKREESVVRIDRRPGRVTGRPGDVLVITDQSLGTLAVYLLEPESDDGLVRWGHLDGMMRPGGILPIARVRRI
ncbi:MAG TPA: M14 family metallopeptidase [Planctomycetota bacterium]|nr:M14 family metallopeptidase [Planctomycetota bacterium]